jgi:hypothetical protein
LAGCTRRTFCLVQCKVPSSSSGIACARHCSLSCWRSPSISSRIRWQNSLASRRRSPSRTLVCFLNNTTNPTRYQTHFVPLHRTTRAAVHDRNTTDTGPSNGFVHRNKHAIAESVPRLLALSSATESFSWKESALCSFAPSCAAAVNRRRRFALTAGSLPRRRSAIQFSRGCESRSFNFNPATGVPTVNTGAVAACFTSEYQPACGGCKGVKQ